MENTFQQFLPLFSYLGLTNNYLLTELINKLGLEIWRNYMKNFKKIFALVLTFALVFSIGAFPAVKAEGEKAEEYSLEDWEGEWNNMLVYFDHEDLQEELNELAEAHEMSMVEFIAHEREESVPFDRLVINGEDNTITFVQYVIEEVETEGKAAHEVCPKMNAKETVEYEYVGDEAFEHAGNTYYWRVFEAKDEKATYPVVFLMEIHGEEQLAHYHIRVGTDRELLAADEGWWPTFVALDTPIDLIKEEIVEHAEAHEHDHDH